MGQGVGGERQTRQVRQASASCGAVGQGVGGERQARQVRQASAGCGAVGQGSGGEGPVRQARQVRQACCGAEGFCLNVSLVSLVSGGPLKVRRAEPSLSYLSRASFLEGPGGGHPPARRACLTCLNVSGGSSGVRGRGDCQPAEGVSVSRLSRGGSSRGPTCRRSQLSRLSRGGVLWGSGGVRQPTELVSLVSGASVLWAGDWRGVSHRSVGNFFRDFSMFCWLDFA